MTQWIHVAGTSLTLENLPPVPHLQLIFILMGLILTCTTWPLSGSLTSSASTSLSPLIPMTLCPEAREMFTVQLWDILPVIPGRMLTGEVLKHIVVHSKVRVSETNPYT